MAPFFRKSAKSILVSLIGLLLLLTPLASLRAQQTIHVPTDQPTIQAAINAANNGDTVLVAPGVYALINFNGKAITVTSSGGPSLTIIDAFAAGPVVTFNTGETTNSQLSGFTIRNGFQNGYQGGGIVISGASPTITGNVITGNHAAGGIGIYVIGGSPMIRNNTIMENDQNGAGDAAGGGGILISGSSDTPTNAQVIANTIINNSVAGGGIGGGIFVSGFGNPVIQNNLIQGNTAYNGGGGIGLRTVNSPSVLQNVIINNSSEGGGSGGGMYVSGTNFTIVANTIAGNSAIDKTSGVFAWLFGPSFVFTDNIVVATNGQAGITCVNTNTTFIPAFSYNDVYSSLGQAWSGVCDSTSLPGNISTDPLFLNAAANDFHLRQDSPLIDVGDNSAPRLPKTDYDGNLRIVDGNKDGVSTVDLGAYEFVPPVPPGVSLSPSVLTFPAQLVATSSQSQTVALVNTGTLSLLITSISSSGLFSQTNNCPATLSGGSNCTINVVFSPTARGAASGAVTIVDNASGSSHVVALSGIGIAPVVSLSTTRLSFGEEWVQSRSVALPVTLSNLGDGTLEISAIRGDGDFEQSNTCTDTLSPNTSCTISAVFSPTGYGTRTGSLIISDNADGSPQIISLSGVGVDFAIASSSDSIDIVLGHSRSLTFYITSLGDAFNKRVALTCGGLPAGITCRFSPTSVTPGSAGTSSVMTINIENTNGSAQLGTFLITTTGSSDNLSNYVQFQLTILKKSK